MLALAVGITAGHAQRLTSVNIAATDDKGLTVQNFNGFQQPGYDMPLVSFRLNKALRTTQEGEKAGASEVVLDGKLSVTCENVEKLPEGGFKMNVVFRNISGETLRVGNIVPFGESERHVYLTAGEKGQPLSRTYIYRPGYMPVNVTLPDNLWELGMGIVDVDNGSSVVAIARRNKNLSKSIGAGRFETTMPPGSTLVYDLYMDSYIGRWQEGLRLMFNDRKLYDLPYGTFDDTLYKRNDLKWVREGYVGHFTQCWNAYVYDVEKGRYTLDDFREMTKKHYGGDEHYMVWSGWPVTGLDQRNQFDLTRTLPGGTEKMREICDRYRKEGARLLTHFHAWDLPAAKDQIFGATSYEHPFETLSQICNECNYAGIMFDTRSEGGKWFQNALDKYNEGVTIFPEGMPVPGEMQYCMLGRTHEALALAPFLNLMRMVQPQFKIYRQTSIKDGGRHRDAALSFFNGHGVEYQLFVPYELDWMQELYAYTGRTVRILRENSANFNTSDWTPLLPTVVDSIWVNEWPLGDKTIYTLYSIRPEGYEGMLFEVKPKSGFHYVDLWNHKEAKVSRIGSKYIIHAEIDPFKAEYLGTDMEAQAGAIARFPELLKVNANGSKLTVESAVNGTVKIWQGHPAYDKEPVFEGGKAAVALASLRKGGFEGDLVIQLFDGKTLLDERIVPGTATPEQRATGLYRKSDKREHYTSPALNARLERDNDLMCLQAAPGDSLIVYPRDLRSIPALRLGGGTQTLKLMDRFGRYEGDFVILVQRNGKTIDSTNLYMPYGQPRIYSIPERTEPAVSAPEGMVLVKGGDFRFNAEFYYDWLLNHPVQDTGKVFSMTSFYMDKHPVTNREFKRFMEATNYKPADPEQFLDHWVNGAPVAGEEDLPVTYVSYEDAKAYAKWAGKRLPTEKEWQYAAQAGDGRRYPWGDTMDSTKCNVGNGILDPVGKYPQGANPLGIEELVGSVWQMTGDWYRSGITSFIMLKGSPYFKTNSSWWYVRGGALPLTNRQQWIRLSQGYERNGTVGFRLVKDAQ